MKHTTIKLLSILLSAVMLLSMLPFTASAAETYALTICGIQVTSDNAADILGDGTVSFDSATNTLTLRGEEIDVETEYFINNKIDGLTVNAVEDVRFSVTGTRAPCPAPLSTPRATSPSRAAS